ncbi:MAG: hypothetical protein DRR06_12240 [Gammaproteobacteria bacterium]|nr:MAG: hypothetical protein DRR06_12240 [Gammaproteobacteria bacterium]
MKEELGVKQFDRIVRIPSPTGFDVGDINSYVILPQEGSKQLVLIDTGVGREVAWQALQAGLGQFGFSIKDITLVLLTHAHTDHFGQAPRIRRESGCEIWGHEVIHKSVADYLPEPPRIEMEKDFFRRLGYDNDMYDKIFEYRDFVGDIFELCELDKTLVDGDVIPIQDFELQTIHTPGHCAEEVVFWQAESRQMFSGDHLLPDITPVCLLDIPDEPRGVRVHSLSQYYESTDKVLPYDAKYIYPSHGDVMQDHRELIAGYKLATERRLLKVSRIMEKHGSLTPFEVGQYLFPKAWESEPYAVSSEVMGHLDMLVDQGYSSVRDDGDVFRYSLISVPDPGAIFQAVIF